MLIGTNKIVFFFSLCTNWYKIPLPRTNRGAYCNIDPFDIGHISKTVFSSHIQGWSYFIFPKVG